MTKQEMRDALLASIRAEARDLFLTTGMQKQEIAEEMGVSPSTISVKMLIY